MSRVAFDAKQKAGVDKNYSMKFYTPEELVIDLLAEIPFAHDDHVLDAGSGHNKVWYNNIPTTRKEEWELDEGKDFLAYDGRVDWVVGNPPFTLFVKFLFKSSEIANKGFGFLTNHSRINQVTPKRLDDLEEAGFYLNKLVIFGTRSWFGRYYFLLFTREKNEGLLHKRKNY